MPRRKRTPEEIARKEKVRELMRELNIHDMSDINALFKEFVGDILGNGLEAECELFSADFAVSKFFCVLPHFRFIITSPLS